MIKSPSLLSLKQSPLLRAMLICLGMGTFAWALWVAIRQVDLTHVHLIAHWRQALVLALAICVNLSLTGTLFWSVTRSFDATPPVSLWRMMILIYASSLMNYLPLRAGLFGRAAYLKAAHHLPVKQSALILLGVLTLGAGVLGTTGLAILVFPRFQSEAGLFAAGMLCLLGAPLTAPVGKVLLHRSIQDGWQWIPLRVLDMLVVGGRTWLAFAILGVPLTYWQAVATGAGGMLVSLLGLTPNGLGLREWAIAGMAMAVSPHTASFAMAAAVLDRTIEAMVVLGLGGPSLVSLGHRVSRLSAGNPIPESQSDPSEDV